MMILILIVRIMIVIIIIIPGRTPGRGGCSAAGSPPDSGMMSASRALGASRFALPFPLSPLGRHPVFPVINDRTLNAQTCLKRCYYYYYYYCYYYYYY